MHTQKLESTILAVIANAKTDDWVPCSFGELRNRVREIDADAQNVSFNRFIEAIIYLHRQNYLLLRKQGLAFDFQRSGSDEYITVFFGQGSFELKLTHEGRRHLEGQSDDYRFSKLAIDEARKSVAEDDGRTHPLVGAVIVKDGQVLATAHRGEAKGNHAEYTVLERKLPDTPVAGCTIYTTLEPCTTRNHPKIPCADRIIERKIRRVVIGMLDPDPNISGRGQRKLSEANVATALFPPDLIAEVQDLNREFNRSFKSPTQSTKSPNSPPSPKHNIRFVEAKSVQAHSGSDGLIYESPQALGDFQISVVCFRNEPVVGQRVQQPTLKSHIIYKSTNGEEITDAPRGVWLGEYGEGTVFESGKKKCLIVFLLSNQDTLKKLWNETYTTEHSWMAGGPLFRIGDGGIVEEVNSVEIQLLAHDTCVLRGEFEVGSRINGRLPKLILRSLSVG